MYLSVLSRGYRQRAGALPDRVCSDGGFHLCHQRILPRRPGLAGGAIAWLLGRSRRSAFIAGILGTILADAAVGIGNWMRGINQTLHLGGAGALDAVVLSGLTAVLLCELFGELMERLMTGRADRPHEDGAIEGGQRA